MKAIITDYRGGRHTQKPNQVIAEVEGVSSKEDAEKLAGKQLVWESPAGKKISGKVSGAHGNKGRVRALMEKGMPGQCVGTQARVI